MIARFTMEKKEEGYIKVCNDQEVITRAKVFYLAKLIKSFSYPELTGNVSEEDLEFIYSLRKYLVGGSQ